MPRPKTRSKRKAPSAEDIVRTNQEEQPQEPLKLLILPKAASPNARICTFPHPRTSNPCRYYFCPEKGIYEFTRIAPPKGARQSWLIGRQQHRVNDRPITTPHTSTAISDGSKPSAEAGEASERKDLWPVADGYVVRSPELLTATPIDPLFLVLPSLIASSNARSPSSKGVFLSADDILDHICDTSPHFNDIGQERIKQLIEGRISAVCDTVDVGDEIMFRLNTNKLLTELLTKARKMILRGLPASMEEKFVRKALERPITAIKREDNSISETTRSVEDETAAIDPVPVEIAESQASTSTSLSMTSEVSSGTNITTPDEEPSGGCSEEVVQLMRLRVALSYILSRYIPQSLVVTLNAKLASEGSPMDFKSLEEELALINQMRHEVLTSRSFSDFSRKRGMEDEGAADLRAEKKAKKEEEEKKRKASETRGVRDLKKVDTSGMKKMSDFFSKKPPTIKKK